MGNGISSSFLGGMLGSRGPVLGTLKMSDFADRSRVIPRLPKVSNPNVIEHEYCVGQLGMLGLAPGFYCIAKSYPPTEPPGPPLPTHPFFLWGM